MKILHQQIHYICHILLNLKNKNLISVTIHFILLFILNTVYNHTINYIDCMSDEKPNFMLLDLNDSSTENSNNDEQEEDGNSCEYTPIDPDEIEEIFNDAEIYEEEQRFFCTHTYEENKEAGLIESARDDVYLHGINVFDTESSELEVTQRCLEYSLTELEKARQSGHNFFVQATQQEQIIKNLEFDVKYMEQEIADLKHQKQQLLDLLNDSIPRQNTLAQNETNAPPLNSDTEGSDYNSEPDSDSVSENANEVNVSSSANDVLIYDYSSDDNPDR